MTSKSDCRGLHGRTDADIAHAAIDALKWKTLVPDGQIKIAVSKGWITPEGEVDWHYQKDGAENAVHSPPRCARGHQPDRRQAAGLSHRGQDPH